MENQQKNERLLELSNSLISISDELKKLTKTPIYQQDSKPTQDKFRSDYEKPLLNYNPTDSPQLPEQIYNNSSSQPCSSPRVNHTHEHCLNPRTLTRYNSPITPKFCDNSYPEFQDKQHNKPLVNSLIRSSSFSDVNHPISPDYFSPNSIPILTYEKLQFVFDIDATLFISEHHLSEYEKKRYQDQRYTIKYSYGKEDIEETYYLVHGAIEMFQFIRSAMPNSIISFFSAGTQERNRSLLKKLNEKISIEVDINGNKGILLRSRCDLTSATDVNDSGFFTSNGSCKNLHLMSEISRVSLEHTIMIDDRPYYACNSQRSNWLIVPSAHEYYSKKLVEMIEKSTTDKQRQNCNNYFYYSGSRHAVIHLHYALGIIVESINYSKHTGIPILNSLYKHQSYVFNPQTGYTDYRYLSKSLGPFQKYPSEYYNKGFDLLKTINSNLTELFPFENLPSNSQELPKFVGGISRVNSQSDNSTYSPVVHQQQSNNSMDNFNKLNINK